MRSENARLGGAAQGARAVLLARMQQSGVRGNLCRSTRGWAALSGSLHRQPGDEVRVRTSR